MVVSDNSHLPYTPRDTGRGIVAHNGKILLMERWRPGFHYFSIPGGGIEAGESPEQTVLREIFEETTIKVEVERRVLIMEDSGIKHYIYLCKYIGGEPHLADHTPEALHMTDDNRFKPGWVQISDLPELPFTYWQPLKQPIIEGLNNGFADQPMKVTINR